MKTVAALFVDPRGIYSGLDFVDLWDAERDARLYPGSLPVVAHPPCNRWCLLAPLNESQYGLRVGEDEGCFASALDSVTRWGGVLEHPAYSFAWGTFGLPAPSRYGWTQSLTHPGYATEIDQAAYGHPCRKRTWLYYVGSNPPPALDWTDTPGEQIVSDLGPGGSRRRGDEWKPGVQYGNASATPEAFASVLLTLATVANADSVATLGNTH